MRGKPQRHGGTEESFSWDLPPAPPRGGTPQREFLFASVPLGLVPALILMAGCGSYTPIDSHYNKGVEFYDQKRLPEAIQEYRLSVEDDP